MTTDPAFPRDQALQRANGLAFASEIGFSTRTVVGHFSNACIVATRMLICNQEVAYDIEQRPHRDEDRAERPARQGLAGADRPQGIRPMVPGEPGSALRSPTIHPGKNHLSRVRAPDHGGRGPEDGARAAVLLPLAPVRRGPEGGLLEGAAHAGRVQTREDARRNAAEAGEEAQWGITSLDRTSHAGLDAHAPGDDQAPPGAPGRRSGSGRAPGTRVPLWARGGTAR